MDLKALLARDDKPRFSAARRTPFLLRIRKVPGQSDLMFVTPTAGSDRSCKEVQQANGTIFSSGPEGNLDIVAMGMSRVDHMDSLPEELSATQSLQVAEDGTVLNIFLRGDTVHVSTARRPDAREARWASDRSFWDFLMDAIPGGEPTLKAALTEGFTYSVVLRHPENTVVLPHFEARIVHVATRRMDTLEECDQPLPAWAARPSWVTLEQASQLCGNVANSTQQHGGVPPMRGFLLVDEAEKVAVRRTLYDLPSYHLAASLRKNKKKPHHSYLACSPAERILCRRVFFMLTPQYDMVDYWLGVLYREVHRKYMRTYVRKTETLEADHPFTPLLRACHKRYRRTRTRIDLPTCEAIVSTSRWVDLDRALCHLSAEQTQ